MIPRSQAGRRNSFSVVDRLFQLDLRQPSISHPRSCFVPNPVTSRRVFTLILIIIGRTMNRPIVPLTMILLVACAYAGNIGQAIDAGGTLLVLHISLLI